MKNKKAVAVFLSCVLVFVSFFSFLIPPNPFVIQQNVLAAYSGTCGKDLRWTLNSQGELRISGTGLMILNKNSYFNFNKEDVKSIVIEDGVRSIAEWAFSTCVNVQSVVVPESVEMIERGAFERCTNLKSITILNRDCQISATQVTISNYYENKRVDGKLWTFQFYDGIIQGYKGSTAEEYAALFDRTFVVLEEPQTTTAVTTTTTTTTTTTSTVTTTIVTSPTDIIGSGSCGTNATWELNRKGTLTISGTGEITSHPWTASFSMTIKEAEINKGITRICNEAFSFCGVLERVSIPDSVTTIGIKAFSHCSKLCDVNIPNSVTMIHLETFYCCSNLWSIYIPDSVVIIDASAFNGCKELHSITLPASVSSIYRSAFANCSNLGSVTILNPNCSIHSDYQTFSTKVIKGYRNSTAEKYADSFNREFVELEVTTTTVTSSETSPSTTTEVAKRTSDLGDPNEDGKVDAKDASLILVAYAKASTGADDELTEAQRAAADVNSDDKVDAKDASTILAYYALVSTAAGDIPTLKEFATPKLT